MVTPDALFEKILTTEILLSMDGIIPSFSELKLRLTATLDRFCHSLMTAGAPQEDVDRLCKILCLCIDARARTMLARQGLSWEGHALTHHYYGYHEEPVIVAEVLSPLLQQPACHIDLYAKRLLFLLAALFPTDSALRTLRFQYETAIPSLTCENFVASPVMRPAGNGIIRQGALIAFVILLMAALSGVWWWCVQRLSEQ
ncbi:DotU family type IV/VI secretion system protein [Cronobacter sakazakii]|uniref:DotU family type IV/VI secretion system protein n=1 Tax=Cronobacter sakazakii TaxID=28141 RepID=UPI000CFDE145|nr:DotU family type IV/VI secretion system protein [Cronobacter sakazakii]EGT4354249.1 hypothetical protein [Cronobacter sakazakii]EJH8725704.1 DotU family type IV/VI secretion system protein [Cronobacter sakazakii]EJJ0564411.1 DotU family type IV/VI secretion system protein [Cronobacter sakazakii]EKK4738642.1 DotU family type IV/VI secretion system protein [Cronobacter sakazakii]EMA8650233.1 DotU family type IV/VI secretion system protein [Cronobacter sakazakii]